MTREIKFRAWDEELKKMLDSNILGNQTWNVLGSLQFGEGSFKFMQFTGLKDKNGVEIYEGDIVAVTVCPHDVPKTYAITNNCEVKWRKAGFILFSGSVDINKTEFFVTIDWENELEVIGNIYQHGDLLK